MAINRMRFLFLALSTLAACTGETKVFSAQPALPNAKWGSAFAPAAGKEVSSPALIKALATSANAVAGCTASVTDASRALPPGIGIAEALDADTARKLAAAGNVVQVTKDGRQLVDRKGPDVIRSADRSAAPISGEGRALLPSALGGDDVLLVAPDSDGFAIIQRLTANGPMTVPLPPGALGVWQVVPISGGGLVASVVEETGAEDSAERVNLWTMAPEGPWTRLTTYAPEDVGGVHYVTTVDHLSAGVRGTVYATALRYATNGGDGGFRSTQVIVDPASRQVSVGATIEGGETWFGVDRRGVDRVGVSQTAAIRWYRLDGRDVSKGGTCDALAPSAYMPDPDLLP